jgi:hypothetical protein
LFGLLQHPKVRGSVIWISKKIRIFPSGMSTMTKVSALCKIQLLKLFVAIACLFEKPVDDIGRVEMIAMFLITKI